MEDSKNDNDILRDIKEVHQKIQKEPGLQYDPSDERVSSGDLEEQMEGSDADGDEALIDHPDQDQKREERDGGDVDSA
ncbi:hypothetical protein EZ449_13735 [Pedobacter frigidisoli]|uniref:Uncharacterized protein n=1 Tax=Pedobacter frigidisoli TaxID=2530455 RepID=A0A4R0P1W6_9SPHI|nr:hypothetical protein [Pedobacter frigidisoli]TCD07597.1 hypothetical protein EZ449_13735 [Pedobacter frigidisoli]